MANKNRAPRHPTSSLASVTPIGSSQAVDQSLPAAVDRIARALYPEQIVLFGSYAYGRPTPDSDVDLLVVMDTDAPATERFLAVSRLLRPRPFPVDILVRTLQEIARALEKGDSFITEIMTQGKVLYERST